jgi:Pro-kumamolisin, activation domain/Bacterial Ig-like domain (group 3)
VEAWVSRISKTGRIVPCLLLSCLVYGQAPIVPSRIVGRVNETERTVLKGNVHRLARPQFDRGPAPPDLPMNRMLLVLKRSPEQEATLETLLDNQQDKASPYYHKWLTPEEFGQRFGPNDDDIQIVTSWLQAHGFQIAKIVKGRNVIEFSGNAAQVEETFHTAIRKYVVNGEDHWANANDPDIPAALTPLVAGVHTLHNFIKRPMIQIAKEKIAAKLEPQGAGKTPMVTFPGTPPLHALAPADYWKIYNVSPLFSATPPINGLGRTIAVVGRSDLFNEGGTPAEDVYDFESVFNVPFEQIFPIVDGADPGDLGGGEEAEATLDVTWSASLAQGATVDFLVSAITNTTDGADLSELYIVDNNLADVMTESFGVCEADYTSTAAQGYETLAEQAAAQGMTYLVASGDSGAEGCADPGVETTASGPISVSLLAATPFNVAVGGTEFNENGQDSKYWSSTNNTNTLESALSYIPEDVWNESCTAAACGSDAGIFAGGGGASMFFPKPTWQSGVAGIPNDGHRDLPDVSLTAASHDPYLLCLEGSCIPDSQGLISFAAVAGTSASTPSFAGIMALVDQKMNGRQGQADYVLYKLAAAEKLSSCNASSTSTLPASTCIFNDVTIGNNAVPLSNRTESAGYQAGVGYDRATGLGSVNVANLVNHWNSITFLPTTTKFTSVTPATITHGQAVNVDIAVTPNSGTGTPSGSVSLIANTPIKNSYTPQTAVGVFPLASGTANQAISSLPGGTYTLTAQYSGDGTFAPSPPAISTAITVSQEPSTTLLSVLSLNQSLNFVPFTGGPYGSFVYLRADVAGQSGQGIPAGPVSFEDGLTGLGEFYLNSQGNTATPNFLNSPNGGTPTGLFTLTPGPHKIIAAYAGDNSFQSSQSSPVNVTMTQAATSGAVSTAAAPNGSILSATISTSSGGTPPSGTVTFFVNGTQVGTPVTVHGVPALTTQTGTLQGAGATASHAASALSNGSYTVAATYSGDSNYLTSTSSSTKFTQQSDFEFSAGSQPVVTIQSPGDSGSLTLTITALDGYNGTINFSSSSCSGLPAGAKCTFKPVSVTGGGSTVLTVTTTGTSGHLIPPVRRRLWWVATTGVGIAGIFLLGGCSRRRIEAVLALMLCAFSIAAIGCGGGNGGTTSVTPTPPPTPPPTATVAGTSNVAVTAASGMLKHTLRVKLIVE